MEEKKPEGIFLGRLERSERTKGTKEVSATGSAVFWIRPNGVPIIQIFK